MAKRKRKRSTWRDTRRLVDPGPDEGGRFSPSPFALQHGHTVEVAPKGLGTELPKDSSFPKRIATQRMIDRYHRAKHITDEQWAAGCRMWSLFHSAGWNPRITSGYTGKVDNETNHGAQLSHRVEAADEYFKALMAVPYRAKGVVIHVVVIDAPASDWARVRGYKGRDSESHGMKRLRAGLSALADYFGY